MTPDRWSQVESVFLRAIELPPESRIKFVEEACSGDETLRREVNSLLACDNPSTPLINDPLPPVEDSAPGAPGRRIGVYRLARLLGQGGMGSVHLAVRDDEQFRMEVAIKLLKRGMDTDFMLSRFRQERQILANLEHPFIARLLDGGATDDGLPYFVLEYVDGLPITKYCVEKNLNLVERLRLFRLVCEAVQHAHQNLVIHRDLKPGNILITREGIPKLLDFGIAKLIDPAAAASELPTLTRRELRLMTPAYASPEQAMGLAINTATDIYSLGAVLYELLSEQRPLRFKTESPAEIEKVICQVEPEKPSVAAKNRQLAGDLDNIILTAMRKEPQRRYVSVAELSEDIRRHMEGLPVAAQEDRWAYRTGKFIRRNRLGVAAAALVLASLVGGIFATTFQARRAERRFQLVRGLANQMLFDFNDQLERLPGSTPLRASLVQTVVGYLDSLAKDAGDPVLDLEIAEAYRRVAGIEGHPFRRNLGQTDAALIHYGKALEIYERLALRPATRKRAITELVGALLEAGDIELRMGKTDASTVRQQRALALATEASRQDSAAVSPVSWVSLYFRLGDAESRRGLANAALPHFQKAVDVCKEWAAADQNLTVRNTLRAAYARLAGAQLANGDLYGARDTYQASLQALEALLQQPGATVGLQLSLSPAHRALGDVLGSPDELNLGDRAGAISHYKSAVEAAERLAAADPQEVRSRDDLQISYRRLAAMLLDDHPAEALRYYQKAFEISSALSKANPSDISIRRDLAAGRMAIGEALHRLRRNKEALDYLTVARNMMQQIIGDAPNQVFWVETLIRAHADIGNVLLDRDDAAGALENYRQEFAIAEKLHQKVPSNLYFQRDRADALESLGRYYARLKMKDEARAWFQKSRAIWQDWITRKVATPFATRRQSRIATSLAALDQP